MSGVVHVANVFVVVGVGFVVIDVDVIIVVVHARCADT